MNYKRIFIVLIAIGCKHTTLKTPEQFANEYCNCLEKNHVKNNFDSAHFNCESILAQESPEFKVYITKDTIHYSDKIIAESYKFIHAFTNSLDSLCQSSLSRNRPNRSL